MDSRPKSGALIAWGLALALATSGCASSDGGRRAAAGAARGVRLAPDPAFAGAQIAVVASDPRLPLDQCRFEWRRNGDPIPGAAAKVLDPGSFAKGDRIEVRVRTPGADERPLEAAVEVANTPPLVTRVTVLPSATGNRAEMRVTFETLDRDGDSLSYAIRWFRNGNPIVGQRGPTLAMSSLALGDRIAAEIVASDGEDESTPVRGEADRIENRPPAFTSQPAAPGPEDDEFRYQAVATDPDGDRLRYELVSGPPGMTVGADGTVTWPLPPMAERRGEYPVTLRVLDPAGGAAQQQFTIRLDTKVAKR